MTALMAICAWITVPFAIPFTLQSFAVFLSLLLLGGRNSFICFSIYIVLGAVGVPVFSSFGAGVGVLLGATGGFIFGFLFSAAVYSLVIFIRKDTEKARLAGCLFAMAAYHLCGAVWYMMLYMEKSNDIISILMTCTIPFVIPDIIKLMLAYTVFLKLKKAVGIK